ncbi:MAG: T9SS type A sorting domain-containing protein [Bacteroidetes bacterium]|nr:T9SS type A sorting domain-containing protein [Bacteroidota bacterium]
MDHSIMRIYFRLLLLLLFFCHANSQAQNMPIGYWRSHMPFTNAIAVATDGVTLFSASDQSFFTFNAASKELTTYSKVEGMSDVGIAALEYDAVTGLTVIGYTNGNIDLFKNETFFNIPDLKLKTISPKTINDIYTENGLAYLSTSFGIVVLDLKKRETKETYNFSINGKSFGVQKLVTLGNYFYAITDSGIFRANKSNPNLQSIAVWQRINKHIALVSASSFASKLFLTTKDSLFVLRADTLFPLYNSPYQITKLTTDSRGVLLNEYNTTNFNGDIKFFDSIGLVFDSFKVKGNPQGVVKLSDNTYWVADQVYGLGQRNSSNTLDYIRPEGPAAAGSFDILPYNGDVWVAHGGYDENWTYTYNTAGVSHFKDGKWTWFNQLTDWGFFNQLTDFIALAKDPIDGTVYACSYRSGLVVFKPDGSKELIADTPLLEKHFIDFTSYRVAGATFDLNGNLWLNNSGAVHELSVKTRDGNIHRYSGAGSRLNAAYILTDNNNLKWYFLPSGGDGVAVYDDNNTPDNPADDRMAKISASQYNLNSYVTCIAQDRQNAIWIGTNDGIGVINCSPDQVFAGNCEIRKPIVQFDKFAGYLFQNEKVRTIAVDGANRKWVGTTNGVWLISPDGDKIIYRFTVDNSPLPANDVRKIAVDPVTGDVYMGTIAGLVSYRSTATEGGTSNESVTTFPNPVPSGYSGTIAIRGLAENSDVRITDIAGQLVFRTKALGGQAVWNGRDYTGHRPQSGVYLIFITNKDGSQTHVGKMVFME